jgi:hypothetical protein
VGLRNHGGGEGPRRVVAPVKKNNIPKYVMETGQQLQYFAPDSITTPGPDSIKGQWNTPVQLRGGEQYKAEVAVKIQMARATCSIVCLICNIATSRP